MLSTRSFYVNLLTMLQLVLIVYFVGYLSTAGQILELGKYGIYIYFIVAYAIIDVCKPAIYRCYDNVTATLRPGKLLFRGLEMVIWMKERT